MKTLLSLALLLASMTTAYADTFVPPQEAFDLWMTRNANGVVELHADVRPGFALYRDKLVVQGDGIEVRSVQAPRGQVVAEPDGDTAELLAGQVLVRVQVGTASSHTPRLLVRYMGCKRDAYCYPPQTATFELGAN